jgi:phosphoribosylformylglycinamidine (FGAM) synthase PurS component
MTVFGVIGFIIFSGTIYLSLIGGLIGVGVGRAIGSRFKSRLRYQSLDQRIIFEMELVLKWATQQRKKDLLDDKCLMLLIETNIMETSYLLEKVELKKVQNYFKKFCKFITSEDTTKAFLNYMPHARDLRTDDEKTKKRALYRLFNFYIPCVRILEGGDYKKVSYKDTQIFKKLYTYVTSEEALEVIIELCEANETLSSQFYIPMEKDELKKIISDCIELREKTEDFKKLENRVMEEIVSNTNIEEIQIESSAFSREESGEAIEASASQSLEINNDHIPV